MSKYTPGPWTAKIDGDFGMVVNSDSNNIIAGFSYCFPEGPIEIEAADARLMAAAPDLLEAAELMLMALKADKTPLEKIPRTASASQFLLYAIKKARGGS